MTKDVKLSINIEEYLKLLKDKCFSSSSLSFSFLIVKKYTLRKRDNTSSDLSFRLRYLKLYNYPIIYSSYLYRQCREKNYIGSMLLTVRSFDERKNPFGTFFLKSYYIVH